MSFFLSPLQVLRLLDFVISRKCSQSSVSSSNFIKKKQVKKGTAATHATGDKKDDELLEGASDEAVGVRKCFICALESCADMGKPADVLSLIREMDARGVCVCLCL